MLAGLGTQDGLPLSAVALVDQSSGRWALQARSGTQMSQNR